MHVIKGRELVVDPSNVRTVARDPARPKGGRGLDRDYAKVERSEPRGVTAATGADIER